VLSILAWWAIPIGRWLFAATVSGVARRVRRQSDDETIAAYSAVPGRHRNDVVPEGRAQGPAESSR